MAKTKYLKVDEGKRLGIGILPNFATSGSITGMKNKYYGTAALLVRCGRWIYNVTSRPEIYRQAR